MPSEPREDGSSPWSFSFDPSTSCSSASCQPSPTTANSYSGLIGKIPLRLPSAASSRGGSQRPLSWTPSTAVTRSPTWSSASSAAAIPGSSATITFCLLISMPSPRSVRRTLTRRGWRPSRCAPLSGSSVGWGPSASATGAEAGAAAAAVGSGSTCPSSCLPGAEMYATAGSCIASPLATFSSLAVSRIPAPNCACSVLCISGRRTEKTNESFDAEILSVREPPSSEMPSIATIRSPTRSR